MNILNLTRQPRGAPPMPLDGPAARAEGAAKAFDDQAAAQMERMVADLGRMYRERNAALLEVTRAHRDALLRLAVAAELRDDDTGVHIVRMGFVAEALALRLGCDTGWARMLRIAAPMHDIGKIGIPDAVLKKAGGLTPEERAIMNRHPEMGAEILGQSCNPLFRLAAEVALSHHERWNGAGYPKGRAGASIPLSGRIVSVVDFFDALTMDRCYRPAFSDDEALSMLAGERGHAFDPEIVDTFMAHASEMIAVRERVNQRRPGFQDLAQRELCELFAAPEGDVQ
jgi:putative two-component system response regulator